MKNPVSRASLLLLSAGLMSVGACRTSDLAGNATGGLLGGKGGDIARAVVASAVDSFQQISTHFSPEQEFYLGRAVAANVIAQHGLDPDEAKQAYVRKIGASIVALSGRVTSTYGGYHFAVLASPKPNGMSGPGGYVFVTRGALDLARNEDEVAGILAHEIAHVSLKHGEKVIRESEGFQGNLRLLGGIVRVAGAASGGGGQWASQISRLFTESVSELSKKLAGHAYGKELEFKADQEGSLILYDVGYDATSIADVVLRLPPSPEAERSGHPEPAERHNALAAIVSQYGGPFDGGVGKTARLARFQALFGPPK